MLPAPSMSKSACILLVEDDEIFLYAIKSLLTSSGYKVLATSGFDPALRYLEGNEKIDLFITDIVMPVNGFALRSHGPTAPPRASCYLSHGI